MNALALAALLAVPARAGLPPLPPAEEARVEDLLRRMTLEEKAGQMTQLTLTYFLKESRGPGGRKELDEAKLGEAVVGRGVGSILNFDDEKALTVAEWRALMGRIQALAGASRLKIPVLYGIDAMHGANYTQGAVLFPKQLNLAAARDAEGARAAYEATARQVRASGIPWDFAPVLDVGRQPLWPRFDETFGEDPYLASRLGAAAVTGLQGSDPSQPARAAASLKHYIGYSFPWTGKDRAPAYLDELTLREYFLPPFEAAVKAGALTAMVNSGEIGGIPGHANKRLLTDVLKGELGFSGLVVSDWQDIRRLHDRDRVAASQEDAAALAVNAGVDMSMVPDELSFPSHVVSAVRAGKIPQSRVDDAVRRILRVKARLGLFGPEQLAPPLAQAADEALSRRLAAESLVLLKNDGVLPLKKGAKLLVAGPAADSRQALNGSWTITWQGDDEKLYPSEWLSILSAVRAANGSASFEKGADFSAAIATSAAVAAAKGMDAVVLVLGEKAYAEGLGTIDDLWLDAPQRELALALEKTGVPVVLVLAEGRPRVLGQAAAGAKAILFAGRPGPYGGDAVADALFGLSNPSGRLPFSYPRAPNDPTTYDRKWSEDEAGGGYNPLFPFGAGLSYTTFRYDGLAVSPAVVTPGETASVSLKVKNEGRVAGEDVVELYLSQRYASVTPSVRKLKGFQRVRLEPGAEKTVAFELKEDDLSFVGQDLKRRTEPGDFDVFVGSRTASFRLERGDARRQ